MRARRLRGTVLIVGEGDSEEVFLKHVRGLYTANNSGFRITIKNACGKGAAYVVDKTVRLSCGIAYDAKVALLDNDTGCIAQARDHAKREGVELLEQSPCIEAWLLSMHGVSRISGADRLKANFKKKFKYPAHDVRVYREYFPKPFLDSTRASDLLLGRLLTLIGV